MSIQCLREILKPFVCQGCSKIEPIVFPPKPVIRAEIKFAELWQLIRAAAPTANIHLSDRVKYLCDLDDINAFLIQDETNHYKYEAEKFDCDDFAYRLMGQFSTPDWAPIAKGIIWTDVHALMCCVDANGDFWYIEPQTDSVKSKLEPWQGSKINLVVI